MSEGHQGSKEARRGILGTILHEVKALIPPTLFFLVSFNLIVFTIVMLTDMAALGSATYAAAVLGAIVVAKAMAVAGMLPFFNRFHGRPLIYNTVWKAFLYFVIAFFMHLAERLFAAATGSGGFFGDIATDFSDFDLNKFITIQLWLGLLLFIYSGADELIRAIGIERVRQMFFGPGSVSSGPRP